MRSRAAELSNPYQTGLGSCGLSILFVYGMMLKNSQTFKNYDCVKTPAFLLISLRQL